MYNKYRIILLLFLIIIQINCQNKKIVEYSEVTYLDFRDFPCGIQESISKSSVEYSFLYNYKYKNDIHTLDFRFNNTCGSAYEDSVSIINNLIKIALNDTSKIHYRCICPHRSVFEFGLSDMETVEIELYIKRDSHKNYTMYLDTLLQLY